jgi:predicted nucleic-acid-binding protein
MIAIDTNVLVRFLVRDDEAQFARASALFERAQRADDAVFLAELVVCELVWVLQRAYRVAKPAIVGTLNELVRARHIELEAADRVQRAIAAYAAGRGDFADYLIREQARAAGCDGVATFDAAVAKESGFVKA